MKVAQRLSVLASTLCVLSMSTPTIASALPDPCKLLTSKEIGTVIGATFGAAKPISATACSWITQPGASSQNVTVTLAVQDAKVWDRATAPLTGVTRLPEKGIGDAAMYTIAGPFASLGVRKGAVTVIIRMYGVHDLAKQKSLERSLAATAIAKL